MATDYDEIYKTLWNVDGEAISILGPRKILALNWCDTIHEEIKNVLEIGCGKGDFSKVLNQYYDCVVGCDISKVTLSRSVHNDVVLADATKLPFHEESFDLIIAIEILEHIQNDREVFERWVTCLKGGGYLIISVPFNKKLWGLVDERVGHYRRYELKDIYNLAKFNKLEIIDIKFTGFPFYRTARFLLNMIDRFRKDKYSAGIVAKRFATKNYLFAILLVFLIKMELLFKNFSIGALTIIVKFLKN